MYHFLSILMSLSCFEEKCFFIKEGSQQQVKCSPLGKSKHSSIPKVESLVAINLDFILFISINKFPGGGAERRSLLRLSQRPGARRVSWEDRTRSPGGYQSQLLRKFYFIITFSIQQWYYFHFGWLAASIQILQESFVDNVDNCGNLCDCRTGIMGH